MQETPVLSKEIEAARLLKATLKDLREEHDAELLADMIEGETSLFEAIDNALADIAGSEAMVVGIKAHMDDMGKRRERLENRVALSKAAIHAAMDVAELRKLQRPLATVSIRAVPPSVVITSEADIPTSYWKPQPPKLDKKALGEALKEGTTIPGASLSNGSETISVRPL